MEIALKDLNPSAQYANCKAACAFHPSTLVGTKNGPRAISSLQVGDRVLCPSPLDDGIGVEERAITRIEKISNAPLLELRLRYFHTDERSQQEEIYVTGIPALHVSGIKASILKSATEDSGYAGYVKDLESRLGWQDLFHIERAHELTAMHGVHASFEVSRVWRSSCASVGWTEVSEETYSGYRTHIDYAHVARDKQATPIREYVDLSDDDVECAFVDRWSFPEPVAFRSDAFVLQVEGVAPIMVGTAGLWIYPGHWQLSYQAIAGRISE